MSEHTPLELAEVEQPQDQLVHPLTGEAIDLLGAPTNHLARFLADVREQESLLRDVKRLVTDELLSRQDKAAEWTTHAEGWKITGKSPEPSKEYDELELREALLKLVDEGVITPDAVDQAVEPVVTYKARRNGINKLRKLGGRVAETVDAFERLVVKDRYVRVERIS